MENFYQTQVQEENNNKYSIAANKKSKVNFNRKTIIVAKKCDN